MAIEETLVLIVFALLLGAISPGPSFLCVARTAVADSRRAGVLCALGVACGGLPFCTLGLAGLSQLQSLCPWIGMTIQLLGSAYLLLLAIGLCRLPRMTPGCAAKPGHAHYGWGSPCN